MLIDFIAIQLQKFDLLAEKIVTSPEKYLQFESVSDVYKAEWLNDFPQGTTWAVTGLDDGAETFCLRVVYRNHFLYIDVAEQIYAFHGVNPE